MDYNRRDRYDFIKTCDNDDQANYVIKSVKEEYLGSKGWEIGEPIKTPISGGRVEVIIPLTKKELRDDNIRNMGR